MRIKIALLSLLCSLSASAHGDHSAPGALPFAPHGGKVGTAEHADDHDHSESDDHDHSKESHQGHDHNTAPHEEEAELYFEGVYDPMTLELRLYPLTIDPKSPGEFSLRQASKGFSNLALKIEFPRSMKSEMVNAQIKIDTQKSEYWSAQVPLNKDIRFFVHLSVLDKGEKKTTKIHLEKRR